MIVENTVNLILSGGIAALTSYSFRRKAFQAKAALERGDKEAFVSLGNECLRLYGRDEVAWLFLAGQAVAWLFAIAHGIYSAWSAS